jgi:hypothetical protein
MHWHFDKGRSRGEQFAPLLGHLVGASFCLESL